MSNIYYKLILRRKIDVLKTSIFWVKKIWSPGKFWGAPTHEGTIEFSNFLLHHKNQRPMSKTMCGFSIILILKGIMTY